jgi:hypothetical protein
MASRKKKSNGFQPSRLFWFLLAIITVTVSIWAFLFSYTIQKYSVLFSFGSIRVLVFSPKYLSPNEDEEIRFAFENPSANVVTVTFQLENASVLPGFLGLQESNTIYSGAIQSQQQINRDIKVFFGVNIPRWGELPTRISILSLLGSVENLPVEKKDLEIYLVPIPRARSISKYLSAILTGLGGLLFRETWEQAKKSVRKK